MHKAPTFVEKLQNTSVAEGHPVRMECRVAGVPYPQIFWKRENESFTHNTDRIRLDARATHSDVSDSNSEISIMSRWSLAVSCDVIGNDNCKQSTKDYRRRKRGNAGSDNAACCG